MVLARQEAAEIRAGATAEARQLVEQGRAAAAERERELQQQRRQAEGEIAELRSRVEQEMPVPESGRLRSSSGCAPSRPRRETGSVS
jgi:hypothetical protein